MSCCKAFLIVDNTVCFCNKKTGHKTLHEARHTRGYTVIWPDGYDDMPQSLVKEVALL